MKHFILSILLCLAGCSSGVTSESNDTTTVSYTGFQGNITEITLKDGTRCAVLVGYNKGAISCDWQTKR